MRNTKSAFTLVELIVVITILAILGTIAFISLQGYSAEARNSKRIQDLSSISSSLNIKLTRGMSVLSAIADDANTVGSVSLAGGVTITTSNYNAGAVNYTSLEMKASEFSDPFDDAYVIGATTLSGGPFELAASVEQDGGEVALVSGNFNNRGTDTVAWTGSTADDTWIVDLTETGNFKVGDITTQWTITKISSDGITIHTNAVVTNWAGTIALSVAESTSLVADGNGGTALSDGGSDLPY